MSVNPLEPTQTTETDGLNRRQLMQLGAAALTAGVILPQQCSNDGGNPPPPFARRPNILLLMTDQERFPQYWPDGWAEANLPNRRRLAKHGLTFNRAFCNAAMCSASRATLFTGTYPAQHGVKRVLTTNGTEGEENQPTLQLPTEDSPNFATMLASAGYDVQYRGKWHISKAPSGTEDVQSPRDLRRYGFHGWVPPESGQDQLPEHFGGGDEDYDGQYAEQAAAFLRGVDPKADRPFALVVSLSNPHDIMGYPDYWDTKSVSENPAFTDLDNYGRRAPECFDQGIDLPPQATLAEDLAHNNKPPSHAQSLAIYDSQLGPLDTEEKQRNYVNFYAYLTRLTDRHMGKVLDALESKPGMAENTIVIRLADHGEMGLSHGGLRQKTFNAYEETIHVPMVFSNPVLFPRAVETDALASLIDVMPTVAALAGVPHRHRLNLLGSDLSPIIHDAVRHRCNPVAAVQDSIIFMTDEVSPVLKSAYHVRCLREEQWKFVINFDPAGEYDTVYELYDLASDPMELRNMGIEGTEYYDDAKTQEMLAKLTEKLAANGIDWA